MKQKDIELGGRYFTNVSGRRVLVEVVQERLDAYSGRTRFVVRRVKNGQLLPKSRSAAALHPDNRGNWPSMTERQEDLGGLDVDYNVYGLTSSNSPLVFHSADELIKAMEDRGFEHLGYSREGGRLRLELQGQPRFRELSGPMHDGAGRIRYETWSLYERMSR